MAPQLVGRIQPIGHPSNSFASTSTILYRNNHDHGFAQDRALLRRSYRGGRYGYLNNGTGRTRTSASTWGLRHTTLSSSLGLRIKTGLTERYKRFVSLKISLGVSRYDGIDTGGILLVEGHGDISKVSVS